MNIEAMAKEAGFSLCTGSYWISVKGTDDNLRRFAKLVAEYERSVCAGIVELEHVGEDVHDDCDNDVDRLYNQALRDAMNSIRERGK